jgi:hypothetical protein
VWISPTLKEVKKQMTSPYIYVACVRPSKSVWMSESCASTDKLWEGVLHGAIAELRLLDANLVAGKCWVLQRRKFCF